MAPKILFVDDVPEFRQAVSIALEGNGYEVHTAEDGHDGIRKFRNLAPDLVLLDIRMPKMSGIDVCTLIRDTSDTPVIMFTAIEEKGDVIAAIQRGATDYVLKDTGVMELLRRVKHHLEDRPTGTAESRAAAPRRPEPDLSSLKVQTIQLDSDKAQTRKPAKTASVPGVSLVKRSALEGPRNRPSKGPDRFM